jgi:hypothetical protein
LRQRIGVLALVVFFSTVLSFAQSPTAVVNGQVRDTSGAAIPKATVVVINDATNVRYTAETNDEGIYSVPNLPPGTYRIQVSKQSFKTIVHPDIVLHIQDAEAIGFTLPVGSTSDTVTVEGGAPLVNTENAAVSTVIDRQFVDNLPMNGRSFNTLLQLTPGVVIAPITSGAGGGQFSIAGQRTNSNNFSVDGVSANFGVTNSLGGESGLGGIQAFSVLGGTSSLVSADDLQEFRIETSSFAAEFGRQPGGQVMLTTRSGTNDFHGGIFEYFRNDLFDANDWFLNAGGSPKAPERHNDFGGVLGGPILKDRTFFYISYEGARLRLPQSMPQEVPSQSARTNAPAALIPYLNAYPLPNGPVNASDPNLAQLTRSWSNAATLNATSLRIDHTFDSRYSVFARYNYAPSNLVFRGFGFTPSTTNPTSADVQTFTAGVNMVFESGITNMVRGNYSTQQASSADSLDSFGGAMPPALNLLSGTLSPLQGVSSFSMGGTGGYASGPNVRNRTKQFDVNDGLTFVVGGHYLKFGGDFRAIWLDSKPNEYSLRYSVASIDQFLSTGQMSLFTQVFNRARLLSRAFSTYGQDTWRLTPRLTLNYGLRWELSPAPSALDGTILTAWENVNNPAEIAVAPAGTPVWRTAYGNFAPRVGVAYSLTQGGDFVLRAGWGLFYDLGSGEAGFLAAAWPNGASRGVGKVSMPASNVSGLLPTLPTLTPPYTGPFAGSILGFLPDLKLPRSYQWNTALEKSFGRSQVISATYVGQLGRDVLRVGDVVPPNTNTNFAPNTDFQLTDNSAASNYQALQLQYRRPLSRGLQALLNYTWSHSLDNASDDFTTFVGTSLATFSKKQDRGNSSFDIRHSFSGAFTYSIPSINKQKALSYITRGWLFDGVVVARTGLPFTVVDLTNSVQGVLVNGRPNLVAGQPLWISDPTVPGGRIVNVNAFVSAPAGQQGNEGRNIIPGFGLTQVDLSVGRKFPLGDKMNLQFRADAFNVLNHPNFANPIGFFLFPGFTFFLQSQQMLNQGLGGLNPLFQEGGPRSLQFSLRLSF